jgi:hypothetical protein
MWRLLVVHFTPRPRAVRLTTEQHLQAVTAVPNAEVLSYNGVHGPPPWLRHLKFDAVVLHTTFLAVRWNPWFERWKRRSEWLGEIDALKIALPQDEYDRAHVLDDWLGELGVSVVGTVLDATHRDDLYPNLAQTAAFYDVLTGYVDDAAARRVAGRIVPLHERRTDLVYRARHLPYWYGSHGQLKHRVGEVAAELAPAHGLSSDISTRAPETVLGDAWLDFLGSGRATVGAESGVSVLDRRGEIQQRMQQLLRDDPGLTFEEASKQMPSGWDDYRFFAVSPRHFEAVATKTAQILVEGSYSGALEAGRHFIPVRRDLSDMDEALEQARDLARLEELTERAYEDVYLSGRYSGARLTETIERMLSDHALPGRGARAPLAVAGPVAGLEASVERVVVEPLANVVRVGRDGYGEMLAAIRLLGVEPVTRRLLLDYLRSTQTREHVSPREALADLLCLGAMRRAQTGQPVAGASFRVVAELDHGRRRIVFESRLPGESDGWKTLGRTQIEELLVGGAWDFSWDHSEVAGEAAYPTAGGRSVELPLRSGKRSLALLNWLAREQPGHVARAVAALVVTRS